MTDTASTSNDSGLDAPIIIASLCGNCSETGETKLITTKVPQFQEIVIISFSCPSCSFTLTEVQPITKVKWQGITYKLKCTSAADLDRPLIKSEFATLRFPEVGFQIPPSLKRGTLSTVEGSLQIILKSFTDEQEAAKEKDPDGPVPYEDLVNQLQKLRQGEGYPFQVVLDDPSGNSWIKNNCTPNPDPDLQIIHYYRTKEQCATIGCEWIDPDQEEQKDASPKKRVTGHRRNETDQPILDTDIDAKAVKFYTTCHNCETYAENTASTFKVPYFRELLTMAVLCEKCGFNSKEVRASSSIPSKAKVMALAVGSTQDLKRVVYKSESAQLLLPELEIELGLGGASGIYSTVEGLLMMIKSHLTEDVPFLSTEDSDPLFRENLNKKLKELEDCIELNRGFSFVLNDPLDNSFIQNPFHPEADPYLTVGYYERTEEQNEEYGLSDMKLENYDEDAKEVSKKKDNDEIKEIVKDIVEDVTKEVAKGESKKEDEAKAENNETN
jgi:zinc finger protein